MNKSIQLISIFSLLFSLTIAAADKRSPSIPENEPTDQNPGWLQYSAVALSNATTAISNYYDKHAGTGENHITRTAAAAAVLSDIQRIREALYKGSIPPTFQTTIKQCAERSNSYAYTAAKYIESSNVSGLVNLMASPCEEFGSGPIKSLIIARLQDLITKGQQAIPGQQKKIVYEKNDINDEKSIVELTSKIDDWIRNFEQKKEFQVQGKDLSLIDLAADQILMDTLQAITAIKKNDAKTMMTLQLKHHTQYLSPLLVELMDVLLNAKVKYGSENSQ